MDNYKFWFSDSHGLIRQRSEPGQTAYPEIWRDGRWRKGFPSVVDAITGMGPDPYSCGEWADSWSRQKAAIFAAANGIDLFANLPHSITREKALKTKTAKRTKFESRQTEESSPARKALRTAKWARIMAKWMISRSSKDGVKWQVICFNGKAGQESKGIVDMIAIRKNHSKPREGRYRGDLFEIILIQVKGGKSKFPSPSDIRRLVEAKKHHRADRVVLVEWQKGEKLCCYLLPDTKTAVPASQVFGKIPSVKRLAAEVLATSSAT